MRGMGVALHDLGGGRRWRLEEIPIGTPVPELTL
jgi:hypothetical protein